MNLISNFQSLSVSQKFGMAFALTYVILIIILIACIWAENPNIVVARRVLLGLIIMSMFALGYAVGNHTGVIPLDWSGNEIFQALIALVFVVLAFVVIGTLNVEQPDITSAKRAIKGMGWLAGITFFMSMFSQTKSVEN